MKALVHLSQKSIVVRKKDHEKEEKAEVDANAEAPGHLIEDEKNVIDLMSDDEDDEDDEDANCQDDDDDEDEDDEDFDCQDDKDDEDYDYQDDLEGHELEGHDLEGHDLYDSKLDSLDEVLDMRDMLVNMQTNFPEDYKVYFGQMLDANDRAQVEQAIQSAQEWQLNLQQ